MKIKQRIFMENFLPEATLSLRFPAQLLTLIETVPSLFGSVLSWLFQFGPGSLDSGVFNIAGVSENIFKRQCY